MTDYLALLLKYQALPRVRRNATFMEIAGYPHYENVCSNILAFYLDPEGEHGLGALLLKAFIKMTLGQDIVMAAAEKVTISREHPMGQDKRIDLVVETSQFTLGIENKIYHWEANDLGLYGRAIDAMGHGKTTVKVVLCLNASPAQSAAAGGFTRHTYRELWQFVRDLLGHHAAAADQKWVTYLYDFMETTSRLAGETPNEREVATFFIEHHEVIERIVADRNRLLNEVAQMLRQLKDDLANEPETKKHLKSRGIWQTYCLASHFTIQGATIGLDLNGDLRGWSMSLFHLNGPAEVLDQLAASSPIAAMGFNPSSRGSSYVVQRWDRSATRQDLLQGIVTWYKALISAADRLSHAPGA